MAFNPPKYKSITFAYVIGFTSKSVRLKYSFNFPDTIEEFQSIDMENLKVTTTKRVVKLLI